MHDYSHYLVEMYTKYTTRLQPPGRGVPVFFPAMPLMMQVIFPNGKAPS